MGDIVVVVATILSVLLVIAGIALLVPPTRRRIRPGFTAGTALAWGVGLIIVGLILSFVALGGGE